MRFTRRWRAVLFLGALLGAALLPGCGGGGGDDGTGGSANLAGNYSSGIFVGTDRMFVFTLNVQNSGAASGNVYLFDESGAAGARTRHFGHPVVAAGPVTGAVARTTLQFSTTGAMTFADGGTTPVTVRGTLLRFGVDKGSVTIETGDQTYTGTFD